MDAVTVVVPTRNRAPLLRVTLASVLRQRGVELRVIVVDEASTDDTAAVIERFGDARISVIAHRVPVGVAASRNEGIARAATEWVAFCDDDDLWGPDKLRRQLAAAADGRADWVYAGSVYVNSDLIVQSGSPPLEPEAMRRALRRYNAMPAGASNVMARRSVLSSLGGFDATRTHLPDWDLWLRLSAHGSPACVREPDVGYRLHAGNASFRTAEMLAELYRLERTHGLTTNRAGFHRHLAHLCLRGGRRRDALWHFAQAWWRRRDGYGREEMEADWRLLREHVAARVRRRLGREPSQRVLRRDLAVRARDPHAAWKARAQAWIDDLPR